MNKDYVIAEIMKIEKVTEVTDMECNKLNRKQKALRIKLEGRDVNPAVYYDDDISDEQMIDRCKRAVAYTLRNPEINTDVLESRESLLGHVYPVLISREKNKDMLEKAVWKHNSDCPSIAMIYKVMFAGYNVTVSQALCEQFGISKDDLHDAAMNNVSNMKFRIINLAERFFDFDDYESLPSEMMMFAVTNDKYIYGANAMLRTDILNDIKNRIGTDIYIIPSSIHEIIVVSAKNAAIDDVKMLVRDVNSNVLDLSDSIFILTQDTVKEV